MFDDLSVVEAAIAVSAAVVGFIVVRALMSEQDARAEEEIDRSPTGSAPKDADQKLKP